jgi:hypothetical protein
MRGFARVCTRALATRLDNLRLNKSMRCKAVLFDLQTLRVEPGEVAPEAPKLMAIGIHHASRLSAPVEELKLETLGALLTYEIRDHARQLGLDSIGPREVVIDRLRSHMAPKAAQQSVAESAGGATGASVREKYEGKLMALRARAELKKRGREDGSAAELAAGSGGGGSGGGGWCLQPGASEVSKYCDNRGIVRALLLRPSAALAASAADDDEVRRTLGAEMAQVGDQLAAPPFASASSDCSAEGLLALCEQLHVPAQSVLLVSSSIELVGVARRSHMFTCYLRKRMEGRTDGGTRRVDPDYVASSLADAVHALDELNGVSFRIIPH